MRAGYEVWERDVSRNEGMNAYNMGLVFAWDLEWRREALFDH